MYSGVQEDIYKHLNLTTSRLNNTKIKTDGLRSVKILTLVLSSQVNTQKVKGSYWDTVDPCDRTDNVSTVIQSATDQVTELVNIAKACDLHWPEHSLAFQFAPKRLLLKSACLWQQHQPLPQKT